MPHLRRAHLSVRREHDAGEAERIARHTAYDLLVVALPAPGADRVVRRLREPDCASRHAGLVVLAEPGVDERENLLGCFANRLLPADCADPAFRQAVLDLLDVAPRRTLPATAAARIVLPGGASRSLRVENLSASGLLLRATDVLPVGTVFGFQLDLPGDSEPVRGRAEVVRLAARDEAGECGIAARFRALGGDAPQRLAQFAGSPAAAPPAAAETTDGGGEPAEPRTLAPLEIERCRAELAALTPGLEELLERGLTRRLAAADWYVAGAETGIESLRAVSSVLASIYESGSTSPAAERRQADLAEARRELAELGLAQRDLAARVRILRGVRPPLARLLREMAGPGAPAGDLRLAEFVAPTVADLRALIAARHRLTQLAEQIAELQRPILLFARSGPRRAAEQIEHDFAALAAAFGIPLSAAALRRRDRARGLAQSVAREVRDLERRLATVHRKVYGARDDGPSGAEVEADLDDPRLAQRLAAMLAPGAAYLARAYGAYRHALEGLGADAGLLDRVERLDALLLSAAPPAGVSE